MAETVFRHRIEYPDNHGITLSEIAATLVAQEKLIPIAVEALERIYPGLKIEKVSIKFDYAETGSLKEGVYVAILATFQKDLEQGVPDLIKYLTGYTVPDQYKTLVTVLSILFLYFAMKAAYEQLFKRKDADDSAGRAPTIRGNYNTYINIASDQLGVPTQVIEDAVNATVTPKRRGVLIKSALDLVRPAKRGGPGRIVVPGLPDVDRQAVAEFPDAAMTDLNAEPEIEPYPKATLEIRATDRDKATRGWYGRLHAGAMSTGRLELKLSPFVDRDALAKRDMVKVEAMVESHYQEDGSLKPTRIHVVSVLDQPGIG